MTPTEFLQHLTIMNMFIAASANWRISSLVSNEIGPWAMFKKFRDWCRELCERYPWCERFHLYQLVECEWCNSVWFCSLTLVSWFLFGDIIILILFPLCLSACVIFFKYIIQTLSNICEYYAQLVKRNES